MGSSIVLLAWDRSTTAAWCLPNERPPMTASAIRTSAAGVVRVGLDDQRDLGHAHNDRTPAAMPQAAHVT